MERKGKILDHAEEVGGGTFQHKSVQIHYTDGGTELFTRVHGGLAWPTFKAPAYFCIFAQQEKKNQFGKRPLIQVFEAEDVERSINDFFSEVKEVAERFIVHLIWSGIKGNAYFEKFHSKHYYILNEPTGAEDFGYGLEVVKAWSKDGGIQTMDNSILRSQLASLRESELKEAPDKFNAINGLRYAVCGFDDEKERRYYYPAFLEKVFV